MTDGHSFYPLLIGDNRYKGRETALVHYDESPLSMKGHPNRSRFIRTVEYKLYHDGRFYNLKEDVLEENPLEMESLNTEEREIRDKLESEMRKHPIWVEK